MQNGPKNGAFFAVKLRPRTPAHRREAAPRQHRQRKHSPPCIAGPRICFPDRGAQLRAHAAGKNPGRKNRRNTGSASNVPARMPAGRERETRTQSRGRAAQRVQSGHRAQAGRGESPRPLGRPLICRPGPIYPRKTPQPGGAFKVPARAVPANMRTLSRARSTGNRPPERKTGFPLPAPNREGARQSSEPHAPALPRCRPARAGMTAARDQKPGFPSTSAP